MKRSLNARILLSILAVFALLLSPVHAIATTIGSCPVFPSNNIWNYDISRLPVHPNSANFITSIGPIGNLHPDFGSGLFNGAPIGIPYVIVSGSQTSVPVNFTFASESDAGPYPIPSNAPIEGGTTSTGDRHVIVINSGNCKLYELFSAFPQSNGSWKASSGAVWDMTSNALRPNGWTSADAAGLPVLPGLLRYDEVASGKVTHALRFTIVRSQKSYLWPARHFASSIADPNVPPMGLRLRLKATVAISSFSKTNQVILTALKQYGMIVADNGSNWFISGAPDSRWDNNDLHNLSTIPGSDFEVVDESSLRVSPDSGMAAGTQLPSPTRTPTTSIPSGATKLSFTVLLDGIGQAGDNSNPAAKGNTNPHFQQRTLYVTISNSQNLTIAAPSTIITYDKTFGNFTGTASIANLPSGSYTIKVKADRYLRKTITGIQSITSGQTKQAPQVKLVAGDINGDNILNILDYNILLGCYSDLKPAKSCTAQNMVMSDLNDDTAVNQYDYNLFIREASVHNGE